MKKAFGSCGRKLWDDGLNPRSIAEMAEVAKMSRFMPGTNDTWLNSREPPFRVNTVSLRPVSFTSI